MSDAGFDSTYSAFWILSGSPPVETIAVNQRLESITRKQEFIRRLFSVDGLSMEVQSASGGAPLKFNPRIINIGIPEGPWHTICPCTITMEADIIYIGGTVLGEDSFDEYISSAEENWSIETDEERGEGVGYPRTYRLTHTLSAVGKRFYDETGTLEKSAWQQARDYVVPRLGLDTSFLNNSGTLDLPSYYGGYNHIRSETSDELGGTYGVTESWILTSGSYLEDVTIDHNYNISDGLNQVSVGGSIVGLEERDSSMSIISSKYDNANTGFTVASGAALNRAQTYTGISLNPDPNSRVIGRNPVGGTISYTFEYNDRPTNLIDGTASESIQIGWVNAGDVFASIPVLGRVNGPVLQNLGTVTATTKSLSINVVMKETQSQLSPSFPSWDSVINSVKPTGYQVFSNPPQINFTPPKSWSYSQDWVYEE